MNNLTYRHFESNQLTANYSSLDWERLTKNWKLTMYLTFPGSEEPVDKPSTTYSPPTRMQEKSFDEVMEEVLEDRAEAWDKLADL
jgi:hypothetical protein